jgi:serine/threonine protein kinase
MSCTCVARIRNGTQPQFTMWLDCIHTSAIPAWMDALQHNQALAKLTLKVGAFALADAHGLRSALRLNAGLCDLKLDLGSLQISTANVLPRGDRRQIRSLLELPVVTSTPTDGDGCMFYLPRSDLSDPLTWVRLGQGNFGVVYSGQLHGQSVCIKQFLDQSLGLSRVQNIRMQVNELALVHELGSQHLKTLDATCVFAKHFAVDDRDPSVPPGMLVILPLMHGTLEDALPSASLSQLLDWAIDLAMGLEALHAADLVHRDVAVRNGLLARQLAEASLVAKLCDFGLSCAVTSPWLPDLVPLDVWPPEVLASFPRATYGFGGDVWAFGLLLVDLLRRGAEEGCVPHAWFAVPSTRATLMATELDFASAVACLMASGSESATATTDPTPLEEPVSLLRTASMSRYVPLTEGSTSGPSAAPAPRYVSLLNAPHASAMVPQYEPVPYDDGASAVHATTTTAPRYAPTTMAAEAVATSGVDGGKVPSTSYYESSQGIYSYAATVQHLTEHDAVDWAARTVLSPEVLMAVRMSARPLLPFVVAWCTHMDPVRRPSMYLVSLMLRHAVAGRHSSAFDWLALPETIVPQRLHETHWTVGDGELLAAICRHRGNRIVIADQPETVDAVFAGHFLSGNARVSDGGAQLLGALIHADQIVLPTRLNFSNNCGIRDTGTIALAQGLHFQTSLTELLLYNNSIGDAGAVALAQSLLYVGEKRVVFDCGGCCSR